MSESPLARTLSRQRVSPEAAAAVLGDPVPASPTPPVIQAEHTAAPSEPETPRHEPVDGSAKKVNKASSKTNHFDRLTSTLEPSGEKKALNVRVDSSLSKLVHEKVFTAKAKGIPMTKDALVSDALKLYFDISE
jgi:hypothetical protein